jgi:hypothetical protein
MGLEIKEYLNLDLDENTFILPKNKNLKISISYNYYLEYVRLQKELKLTSPALMVELIENYKVNHPHHLKNMRRGILARINRGVGYEYILQLKLLYYALGHFLKRIRVI